VAKLPTPRGPLSEAILSYWTGGPPPDRQVIEPGSLDAAVDEDLHLALWCCYQLHFTGFDGLDHDPQWDPTTIAFRVELETAFEQALREEHRADGVPASGRHQQQGAVDELREEHRADGVPADPTVALRVISTWAGPPLSETVRTGTKAMLDEFAVHRSIYQLKEADGHTFGIPHLRGPGRAAMLAIQTDEYGSGEPGKAHSELFAEAMAQLGLDPEPGAYVDSVPGTTLATDNLVNMFGLNRRLRGALIGHLALFEMCSVTPMSRYLEAARRIGGLPAVEEFFAVHVEADVEHSRLALDEMVAPFVAANRHEAADVIFGAAALARVEARFARHVLDSWAAGRSSLAREPHRLPPPEPIVLTRGRWNDPGGVGASRPGAPLQALVS
jgi:hypothetical protein